MPTTPIKAIAWQMQAQVRPDDEQRGQQTPLKACFVVGTSLDASELSDAEVIRAYKGQAQAEGGFRLLNDPLFFAASLLVKKPLSDSRAAEGDDLSATGLFGDATPPAPPMDVPGGDGAKPAQPTDCAADLAVGLPPA